MMDNEKRRAELLKTFANVDGVNVVMGPMVNDMVFLEQQLSELRQLPFIRVNPNNPAQQKPTAAAKQYKELLQQYNNCVKIIAGAIKSTATDDESPLRAFLRTVANGN